MDAAGTHEGIPQYPIFSADEPIPLTGERTSPGIPEENYWFQRHVAAYRFAAGRMAGLRVLDAGCGEGYGADVLAGAGCDVVGVDLDPSILRRAAQRYPRASFEPADLVALPYADGSFDAVVSLQVIEHLQRPSEFVRECLRVLRPAGMLVIATPNRLTFSPEGIRNPFHTVEFSASELRALLGRQAPAVTMLGTFHGARLAVLERVIRTPLPERLIAEPAPQWPRWLRSAVARVRAEDFRIRPSRIDRSLDLVAIASRGPA